VYIPCDPWFAALGTTGCHPVVTSLVARPAGWQPAVQGN